MVKISIIVPVYNTEKYLRKCFDSIQNQTFQDFEVIAIDDGSTDSSFSILKEYEKDKRFQIIHKENEGQAVARNLGIQKAIGEYLTFVDSDDFIENTMLENLYECAQKEDDDIVICDIQKETEKNSFVFKNYWNVKKDANKNYMTSHMGPVARLYKRELFIKNNISFKENIIYEDLATIPLLGIYAKKIGIISKPLYHYLIRSGSTMKQEVYHPKLENIFTVMDYLTTEFEKKSGNTYQEELEYLYTEHLLYSASLRFLKFHKKEHLKKIKGEIKERYPRFYKNPYFKEKSIKFKMICFLFYYEQYTLLSWIVKGRSS